MDTKHRYHIPVLNTNLSINQKGIYYTGSKLYNNLPLAFKSLSHDIYKFKPELKQHLQCVSFTSTLIVSQIACLQ